MRYKRLFIQNAYIHLVLVAYNRKNIFIQNIKLIKQAFLNAKKYFKFHIIAICVLPDHIHVILNPTDINEYPKIITSIKYYFSKNYPVGVETPTYGYTNKGEKGVFQRRFFEHTIISEKDLNNQVNYIHYNPVKHELVKCVKDWEFSTFNRFVKIGLYEDSWGSNTNDIKEIQDLNFE